MLCNNVVRHLVMEPNVPYMPWVQAHSTMVRAEGLKADKHTCGGESLMEHKDQEDESRMFTWFISQKDEKGKSKRDQLIICKQLSWLFSGCSFLFPSISERP